MAKGTHALGRAFRGRVGDKTYYVRGGRLIAASLPASRPPSPPTGRQLIPRLAVRLAHRWRQQLAEAGVVVPFDKMLEQAYAVVDAPTRGDSHSTDSYVGAWSSPWVVCHDGLIYSSIAYLSEGRVVMDELGWGKQFPGEGFDLTQAVIDYVPNFYPSGSVFVSVVGESVESSVLVIGRRVDIGRPLHVLVKGGDEQRLWGVRQDGDYVWRDSLEPPPHDAAYFIDGWQSPLVVMEEGEAFSWMVIGRDGFVYDAHTLFISRE